MKVFRWLVLVAIVASGGLAFAQRGPGGYMGIRRPGPDSFTGAFTFCRIAFRGGFGGYGGGWGVDYPRADQNLPIRLSELTRSAVNMDASGVPHYVVIQATEPELFQCPFVALTNSGQVSFSPEESASIRAYLLKGGFLWADDSWGSASWAHWEAELRNILPASEYPLVDLPINHAIFHTLFDVNRIPQIPNIGFFRGTGSTSERGSDSAVVRAAAVVDARGRVMAFTTHNTDFGDAYEREGDDPEYFLKFSVEGYAVGINVLLYAMTH